MPDRLIREGILNSEPVNSLSWPAEVFYRRLMSVVDDFGRFDGRVVVLRGSLYNLKLDRVSVPDVAKWIRECETAGLVRMYAVEGKQYVEIPKFHQRLKTMRSRWPPPGDNPTSPYRREEKGREGKTPTLGLTLNAPLLPDENRLPYTQEAIEILEFLNTKTGRKYRGLDGNGKPTANLSIIMDRLKTGVSVQDCKTVIARKHWEWTRAGQGGNGKDMFEYLRPSTLFRASNFETYLGQCVPPNEENRRAG